MHISEIFKQNPIAFSYELFPPKSKEAAEQLFATISNLSPLELAYVSVTYGAGGSTRDLTHNLVTRIQEDNASVMKNDEIVEEVIEESVTRLKKRFPSAVIQVQIPVNPLCIPMDAMLIEQVIINLLENALVHAESDEPIQLTVTEEEKEVVFGVRDYGIGVADVNTVFDGIPQAASPSSDSHRGMGIGLTICRTIVLAHGGQISAKNHEHGVEFIFTLPREEEADETFISNSDH